MAIPPQPDPACPYPHHGDGPWPCCQIYAENFPANRDMQVQEFEVEPLPGWTAQHGDASAIPLEVCPICGGEFRQEELHLHTRITHGYELAVDPVNRTPHPYSPTEGHVDGIRTEEPSSGPSAG